MTKEYIHFQCFFSVYIFLKCLWYFNVNQLFKKGWFKSIKMDVSWLKSTFVPMFQLTLLFRRQHSLALLLILSLNCPLTLQTLSRLPVLMPQDIDFIEWYNFETYNNTFNCYKFWACSYDFLLIVGGSWKLVRRILSINPNWFMWWDILNT